MRKVLIITYYWPPAGGGGVQRWLKFAKYLPQYGWSPVIYTPADADYPLRDVSLMDEIPSEIEIVKRPIREPRTYYRRLFGIKEKGKSEASLDQLFYTDPATRSWVQTLSIWLRGNMFIPDARAWWINPSTRFLLRYIKQRCIETIVTTGPPHSMHMIGLGIKHRMPAITWVADFRDPWTSIEYYDHMMLTNWADRKHHRLELEVLQHADAVITVSPSWAAMLGKMRKGDVEMITNGYDADDFAALQSLPDQLMTICHVGTMALDRNPVTFWSALMEIARTDEALSTQLKIKLIGSTDPVVLQQLSDYGLKYVDLGYVSHATSIAEMCRARFLLLPVNQAAAENMAGRIPGKVFEYLAANRPIIGLCPEECDVARLLKKHGHLVLDPGEEIDIVSLKKFLMTPWQNTDQNTRIYSRSYLAEQLAGVLQRATDTISKL